MIEFSNGHKFEYMTASGALGYDGEGWPWERPLKWIGVLEPSLFTSVVKTLTLQPLEGNLRKYNPSRCLRFISEGVLNAVGLTNPGIYWWCQNVGSMVDSSRIPLVVSILGEPAELAIMANMLSGFDIVGLEVNASCPNVEEQDTEGVIAGCKAVKGKTSLSIILKISVDHDIEGIVQGTQNLVEAYSINSVPWKIAFPNQKSPLFKLGGGGVSGKAVQEFTWGLVEKLVSLTSVPVIGPSVWDFKDLKILREKGAQAISFGSIFLRYPWRPTSFIRKETLKV